jgi:hypothetical protein
MEIVASEQERGRSNCNSNIASGCVRLFWQTRSAWGDYLSEEFESRFGVRVLHISDLTNSELYSFHSGYNQRTIEYIDTTFGHGSFEAAMNDVEAFRRQRYYLKTKNSDGDV